MKKTLTYLPLAVTLLALICCGGLLAVYEGDYLWNAQEQSLFLYDSSFFRQLMTVPAGWLSWAGAYFTQFFYHPWVGVSLLCGWWAVLAVLTARTFRLPWRWFTLTLIPIALLLLAIIGIDYWIYYLKLKGHLFVPTIGWTLAVALVWIYRSLPMKWMLRLLFLPVAAVVAYPLMGWYGLAAVALMGVVSWRLGDMSAWWRVVASAAALVLVAAVPLVCYRYVYHETNIGDMWLAGLPVFTLSEHYDGYDYPYILLPLYYLTLACLYRERDVADGVKRVAVWSLAQCVVLATVGWGTYHYWYKDTNFHQELAMKRCLDRVDWNAIVDCAQTANGESTRAMMMMKNLALFRLGRLGDEMYLYGNGNQRGNTPLPIRMVQVVGKALYLHYGLANYCYRWCTEDGVEYGWRTETLKLMTQCAIVNREPQLARKYIGLLKLTRYHKDWAERQEQLVSQPQLVVKDPVYAPILPLMGYDNSLNSDLSIVETFLMNHLARTVSDQPQMQELSLVGALWRKNIPLFWARFFQYLQLHPGQHVPRHYQEAAYLYTQLEHQVDPAQLPLDESVGQNYQRFTERVQQYPGASEQYLSEALRTEFGGTFYYEYFLNRDQQCY